MSDSKSVIDGKESGRIGKRALSIGLAAILVLSSIVIALPVKNAYAASIETSVDNLGNRFFGPSLVRVLITDTAKTNDNDSILVTVEARRGTNLLGSVQVPVDAIGTSGQFELYIAAHTDATPANPTQGTAENDDSDNNNINGEYSLVRIYNGANSLTDDANTKAISTSDLQAGDKIRIIYGGQTKEITFEPTTASLSVDRTVAGSNNNIILRLNDQDANIDPTKIDEFLADTNNNIASNNTLAPIPSSTNWKETGQNTGIFELVVTVETITTPSSVTFTLTDNEVYTVYTGAKSPYHEIRKTTSTDDAVVQLRNSDGSIDLAAPLTIANGFQIRITDTDRNIDTTTRDSFTEYVTIKGTNAVTLPSSLTFKETGDNTGIFLPDLANNKIEIVPVSSADDLPSSSVPIVSEGDTRKIVFNTDNKIYVVASALANDYDITITYEDPTMSAPFPAIVRKIQHFAGDISTTTTTVPVTGKAVIEINDMDLNKNPNVADVYTLTYTNTTKGNSPSGAFNGLAELNIKVNGSTNIAFGGDNTSIQLVETDKNTGIFRGELDVSDITTPGLSDGDKITFEYIDNTESPTVTRTVDVRIGKPSGTIELDRSSYPPSTTLSGVGERTTKIHVTITDPSFNNSSTSQDILTLKNDNNTFENGELRMQLIKGNTTITMQPGYLDTSGGSLNPVPSGLSFPASANETGVNTGVFTVDIDLPRIIVVGSNNYQIGDGWQLKLIYKDSNGDEQTVTASIVTNTASITTDKPSYDLGQTIVLTINEPDWNNDSDKVDEISTNIADLVVDSDKVSSDKLAQVGTLPNITLDPSNVLRETDKNSGIFQIQIKNINNNLVSRDKNLEFTYTDKTPAGGGTEIDVKHVVLITAAQVSIILDKENYTPFDRIKISIVDPSANTDPDTKDNLNKPDARVRITVGGTSQEMKASFEETGANTGVFEFKDDKDGIKIKDIKSDAKPGDGIRVEYRSPDKQVEIAKTAIITFNSGSIKLDKESYKVGETVILTVEDSDENRNPDIPDQFNVKVVSTTDPAGVTVLVRETGDSTGKFTGTVILTSGLSSGNRLQVSEGDTITAVYTDETLPNAQTITQQLVNRENVTDLRTLQTLDIQASATVGVSLLPTDRTTISTPKLTDQAGNPIEEASVDTPVSIASSIKNNTNQALPFVYIVQVTDENGAVVSISTVGGTLAKGQSFNVSASWTPTAPGNYTIDVFVWSELGKPSPLSKVESINVIVM